MSNLIRSKFEDKIEKKWLDNLLPFLSSDEMQQSFKTIKSQKQFRIIYPEVSEAFNAFKYTPWDDVRVVLVGQDPYHDGSAHGLAFSTVGSKCPPSLKNILLEVEDDCYNGLHIPRSILLNLEGWARQGVLLLNTALTVEKGKPGSHSKLWSAFTIEVFRLLRSKPGTIYMLWGNHAKNFKQYIDLDQNYVLEAGHPSPLNTKYPFKGCKHFSKVNEIITKQNGAEFCIDWSK